MGLMALNLATLNVRGLRDPGKCTCLLGELKTLGVDVAAVQETHFTCGADCRVLESDFNVFSAYGSRTSVGVSLLVGRSLDADVDVVFADDGDRLVVADVAVKSFKFRLVAVYAPNIVGNRQTSRSLRQHCPATHNHRQRHKTSHSRTHENFSHSNILSVNNTY